MKLFWGKGVNFTFSLNDFLPNLYLISGLATGVARGRVPPLTTKKLPKIGKIQEKLGKNQEKSGKRRKNREEKAKIGKFLSFCPS